MECEQRESHLFLFGEVTSIIVSYSLYYLITIRSSHFVVCCACTSYAQTMIWSDRREECVSEEKCVTGVCYSSVFCVYLQPSMPAFTNAISWSCTRQSNCVHP
ncbi:uncharacterized protein K460DRAFT_21486 [Cucurbitaria berberidis CBS 394.84]|uniref:Uncharacterized protein n=1 Tax=Cucurbitaria berberidis CBS 394.84 TaxID=1168544 RepID=A0A9P4GS11_9PLEO|nr:uncharacterized protein K460DRAFT_21486 [Cucurbitaria berberidis CBS 394.84]KAF1850757.1 hypothetical protein K460DRAFT_21486 [Cucurbitaria berberidis CBS 394.84]